jgi:hypothetical protein
MRLNSLGRIDGFHDVLPCALARAGASLATALAALALAAPAAAAGPAIDLAVPEPAAPVDREYRQHEGFYLRANVGLGSFSASGDVATVDLSTGGMSLAYDLLVGFGPAPGFALGAGVAGDLQLSGDWEFGPVDGGSGDLSSFVIGPFVDAYPNPKGGWHFGGLAGLGLHSLDAGGGGEASSGIGFGGAAWAGHDVWVGPEWSVGGQLRLDASRTTDDDLTIARIGLSLSFSVIYN